MRQGRRYCRCRARHPVSLRWRNLRSLEDVARLWWSWRRGLACCWRLRHESSTGKLSTGVKQRCSAELGRLACVAALAGDGCGGAWWMRAMRCGMRCSMRCGHCSRCARRLWACSDALVVGRCVAVSAVADGLASIHGKIKSHITNVVDALKSGSNSTTIGAVSGALRTSDPSNSYKMAPVSKLAAAANARNASLALTSVWGNAMQTARSAITAARGDAGARAKAGGAGPGVAGGKAGSGAGDTRAFAGRKGPQQGDMGERRGAGAGKAGGAGGAGGGGGRPDGAVETRRPMMMSTPGN